MLRKTHILLVETGENEIGFFKEALKESGLSFLCSTARNAQQAVKLLKNTSPNFIFINVRMILTESLPEINKLKLYESAPVVLYSGFGNVPGYIGNALWMNYVQLPDSAHTMGRILKNLLAGTGIISEPAELVEA